MRGRGYLKERHKENKVGGAEDRFGDWLSLDFSNEVETLSQVTLLLNKMSKSGGQWTHTGRGHWAAHLAFPAHAHAHVSEL